MSFTLEFTKTALSDLDQHKKPGNRATLKKIERLLTELMEHPATGTGKPEKLKYDLEGLYSRRINSKHRLVYKIQDETGTVLILSAYGHYND